MVGPTSEIKDADGDEEEFVDHFVALRMLPNGRLGLPLWMGAHLSVQLLNLALWILAFAIGILLTAGISALGVGVLFDIGKEEAEVATEAAPFAWKATATAIILGLACAAAIWATLAIAARNVPATFSFPHTAARRPRRREVARQTRRQAAARARRSGWIGFLTGLAVCIAVGSVIIALTLPSMVSWEGGISLLAHVGRLLFAAILGSAAVGTGMGVLILGWLLLMTAGLIRAASATRLLPGRARVKVVVDSVPQPWRPQPVRAKPGDTPSPSLLTYLYADRLPVSSSSLGVAAPVPCTNRQVKAIDLSATLFAVAFWSLREQDTLRLRLGRRRFPLGRRRLEVTRIRTERRLGLEGVAMDVPNIDPDAWVDEDTTGKPGALGSVRDVIGVWFKTARDDPEWKVVVTVLKEAAELGLVSREEEKDRYRLHCDAIAREKGAFDAFAERWRRFEQEEPAICSALRRECASAIRGARSLPEAGGPVSFIIAMGLWLQERSSWPWPQSADPGR